MELGLHLRLHRDEHGAELTFFNRIGFDQVTTRLYNDTIHYVKGGLMRHCYTEDADFDDEQTIDELPVVFGREDLLVRHFATKDDIKDARPQTEKQAEWVEFKQQNGRYAEWTDLEQPAYGEVQLRISVKGKPLTLKACLLPRLDKEQPIVRDFDNACIRYRDLNGDEAMLQDFPWTAYAWSQRAASDTARRTTITRWRCIARRS